MKVSHCNQIGCRELVKQGERYCSKHKALHQWTIDNSKRVKRDEYRNYNMNRRNEQANNFYHSREWQAVRKQVLIANFYSDSVTGLPAVNGERLIVDHIIPLKLLDSKEEKLNPDNLWVLSQHVHSIKSAMEKKMTDVQLKHVSRKWWNKVLKEKIKKG